MKLLSRAFMSAVALSVFAVQFACAQTDPNSDVRDLVVGMPIRAIPTAGYIDLSCADDASRKLRSWSESGECPSGVDGLRAVRFEFDSATSRDGTWIAGHPVILTALVDGSATLAGLKIDTDPEAKLYMRKKAFLLGAQVKSRYGSEGWVCARRGQEAGERPVGGIYIRESCRKALRGRVLMVERDLFRRPDQGSKDFVNSTRVSITRDDQ
ncbi:hypothetical protein SAMN05443247_00888 [Bradyrhizobium erythrophlei]|jgi:hypothetical protein|nr:hypothetical protein SAMN05443247_00888 [Bradyrhizobium erythrophlei]